MAVVQRVIYCPQRAKSLRCVEKQKCPNYTFVYASFLAASQQPAAITAVATRKRGVSGSPSNRNDRAALMKGGQGVVGAGAGGADGALGVGVAIDA